jgi:anthraniloyl-CoA monooxygenase
MFTPFRLRGLTLANRVVVSPMDMYSAEDGTPNDFHLVHLGARALGGAGLIITEMTCVSPEGRITPGCTGMYAEAHVAAWRRIVDFVHARSRAAICLQLGHSGGKGSTRLMWEGMDEPLPSGGWEVMAASPVAYRPGMQVPREMTRADMDAVLAQFVRATHMAAAAGFDMLELHCAHGYLLSGFITPLLNRRRDGYGGALANRLRFPLEVFAAMRAVWPEARPMSVRVSATDWVEDGLPGEEAVAAAAAFHQAGADILHVSTGRPRPRRSPCTAACFRRHGATASGTRPACRRSPSATSPSPTRSTRSSPPAAPTSARSPARTSPTRTGPSAPPRSWGLRSSPGRCNI